MVCVPTPPSGIGEGFLRRPLSDLLTETLLLLVFRMVWNTPAVLVFTNNLMGYPFLTSCARLCDLTVFVPHRLPSNSGQAAADPPLCFVAPRSS